MDFRNDVGMSEHRGRLQTVPGLQRRFAERVKQAVSLLLLFRRIVRRGFLIVAIVFDGV